MSLKPLFFLLFSSWIFAQNSPVVGYTRNLGMDKQVHYKQTDGNFSFVVKSLIDNNTLRHKGTIDNYDDAYIENILSNHTPFKQIKGSSDKRITIAFRDQANEENFLKEFGLEIFKEQNLTIDLVRMDKNKIDLPMHLEVYPLFVIGSRYIQGIISKRLLKGLIEQSTYPKDTLTIPLKTLKATLLKKYGKNDNNIQLEYNDSKKLFEVREVNSTKIHSYISKDGRYILML